MSTQSQSFIYRLSGSANILAMIALASAAAAMTVATLLAFAGVLPWPELQLGFGGTVYAQAGQVAQIALTVLLLLLCVYLPSAQRVMRLETSHRRFAMGMEDVARAYALAHATDRAGTFTLSSEYDAVRERMAHLRAHPDLDGLEPEILELAAQMSRISQHLADTYSDAKVDRARAFLDQRQHEIDAFNDRINQAKQVTTELKSRLRAVEMDESVADSQIERLRESLAEILPELSGPKKRRAKTIVPIAKFAAE